ncbi:hypothetical protein IFM89_018509 [Coptis chinensis]|uniref:Cupin type-1 domain-containing protein n=1 Tax=Coptis chinensis TaxID=261450 RepID=A0A835M9F0_9MAGN|nr:hypothetical protein IFM89_018509 [Coptis chinensis]
MLVRLLNSSSGWEDQTIVIASEYELDVRSPNTIVRFGVLANLNTYDEKFSTADFKDTKELEKFIGRFRPTSVQVQDNECSSIQVQSNKSSLVLLLWLLSQVLKDFCIADSTSSARVNGVVCKDPKLAQANDFFFSGLHLPGNTSNFLGSKVTPVNVAQLPRLNTLGISMVRIRTMGSQLSTLILALLI